MNKNEAFSRVFIDAMLAAQGWNIADSNAVRFEVMMPDAACKAGVGQVIVWYQRSRAA